jgi:hypothetical protein
VSGGRVGFEKELAEALKAEDGTGKALDMNSRERPHVSRSKIEVFGNTHYISADEWESTRYEGESSELKRYLACKDLTYDLMLSVYDVNSCTLACARLFSGTGGAESWLRKLIAGLRKPNLEARLIGLQDGEDASVLSNALTLLESLHIPVVEADLFGTETRHVAIDAKQGMSFNILIEDRLYRPGELLNKLTLDQFRRAIMAKGP